MERTKDSLGHNHPRVLRIIGEDEIPRRVMDAGRVQASLIRLQVMLPVFPLLNARKAEFPVLLRLTEALEDALSLFVPSPQDVLFLLAELFLSRGISTHIRSDNGPKVNARKLRQWLNLLQVTPLYIEPGSPWKNGYVEALNGKMREQCLNGELFYTLKDSQVMTDRWSIHYNTARRIAVSAASHTLSKPSSLRAGDEHGRWYKNSRLVMTEK